MVAIKKEKDINLKNQVIILLLTGLSVDAIAKQLNVSDTTIHNWLKEPDFKQSLIDSSEVINTVAMSKIVSLNDKAIDCLSELLDDSTDKVKLTAIKIVLDSTNKWLDRDLVIRLEKLENMMKGLKNE